MTTWGMIVQTIIVVVCIFVGYALASMDEED